MRFLVVTLWLICAGGALAQTVPESPTRDPLQDVFACADIQDDVDRHACYDRVVPDLRQAATEGQLVVLASDRVRSLRTESFGFNLPNLNRLIPNFDPQGRDIATIQLQVDRVINHPGGNHSFVMTDGQVWEQLQAQRVANVRSGDTVSIRRAAMGSFMLTSQRGGSPHRVRRER